MHSFFRGIYWGCWTWLSINKGNTLLILEAFFLSSLQIWQNRNTCCHDIRIFFFFSYLFCKIDEVPDTSKVIFGTLKTTLTKCTDLYFFNSYYFAPHNHSHFHLARKPVHKTEHMCGSLSPWALLSNSSSFSLYFLFPFPLSSSPSLFFARSLKREDTAASLTTKRAASTSKAGIALKTEEESRFCGLKYVYA